MSSNDNHRRRSRRCVVGRTNLYIIGKSPLPPVAGISSRDFNPVYDFHTVKRPP